MKVFQFFVGEYFYICCGHDKDQAKAVLFEYLFEMEIDRVEEIPESEWDKKIITIHEDNNPSLKSWKVSIREIIEGDAPQFIATNDFDILD